MRRKKDSRKLAKIHVHHKHSANTLSIMHSPRDQKVLITRMENKPEQNTSEGGSQPLFLRDADPQAQGNSKCSAQLSAGPSVNRIYFPGIFLGSRKFNRFWIHITGLHKDTHRNSLSQTPNSAVFGNNVRVSPTHSIFGWHYGQAKLHGESLLQIMVFKSPRQ